MRASEAFTATATADIGLWIGSCATRGASSRSQAVYNPSTSALARPVLPAYSDVAAADTLAATT